jgi:cyanate permease
VGLLKDATGSFAAVLLVFSGLAAAAGVLALRFRPAPQA